MQNILGCHTGKINGNTITTFLQHFFFSNPLIQIFLLWTRGQLTLVWLISFLLDKGSSTASRLNKRTVSAGRRDIQRHLIIIAVTGLIMLPTPIKESPATRQPYTWQDGVEGVHTDIHATNTPTYLWDCRDGVFSHRHWCKQLMHGHTRANTLNPRWPHRLSGLITFTRDFLRTFVF